MAHDNAAPVAAPPLTAEQEKLVRMGMSLLPRCAADVARRAHGFAAAEELMSAGALALDEAARVYRAELCPSFLHFARHHVQGRMIDALREEVGTLRARVELSMDKAYCRMVAQQTLDVDLFHAEDEVMLESAREGCADALAAAFVAGVMEAEAAAETPEDKVAAVEGDRVMGERLRAAMGELSGEERAVVVMVYEEGMTMGEAAKVAGVSERMMRNRMGKAMGKLRKRVVREG